MVIIRIYYPFLPFLSEFLNSFFFLKYPIFVKNKVRIFLFVTSVVPGLKICQYVSLELRLFGTIPSQLPIWIIRAIFPDLLLTLEPLIEILTKGIAYTPCFLSRSYRGKKSDLGKSGEMVKLYWKSSIRRFSWAQRCVQIFTRWLACPTVTNKGFDKGWSHAASLVDLLRPRFTSLENQDIVEGTHLLQTDPKGN